MADLLTISEVSRRSGVASSALRFYEERGLIALRAGRLRPPPLSARRCCGGSPSSSLRSGSGCRSRRSSAELAKLPRDRVPTRPDWARLSRGWTSKRIDQRIAELQRLEAGLTECIGCGCLSLDQCSLANPADRAARLGPGPRYWIGDRPPRSA